MATDIDCCKNASEANEENQVPKLRVSISRKILMVFTSVFVAELLVFTILLFGTAVYLKKEVSTKMVDTYLTNAVLVYDEDNPADLIQLANNDISLIVITKDGKVYKSSQILKQIKEDVVLEIISNSIDLLEKNPKFSATAGSGPLKFYYSARQLYDGSMIVGIATGEYLLRSIATILYILIAIYCVVFLIGSLAIIAWARGVVSRINSLCDFVTVMPEQKYKHGYIDSGNDELGELSLKINDMRKTILEDECEKNAMLQNISHDLKTPIAVIRSYAEAIGDGIEDISSSDIIIEQSIKLEKKVKKLIEFNKIEYLSNDQVLDSIAIAPIISDIINNFKHLINLEFDVILDDTEFKGKYDKLYTACENIIENGTRYAKTKIVIRLEKGVLTIYNDGPHIAEEFIVGGFKPYQKGFEGKFGLGMSIVTRVLDLYNLKLTVKNEEIGVSFTISNQDAA